MPDSDRHGIVGTETGTGTGGAGTVVGGTVVLGTVVLGTVFSSTVTLGVVTPATSTLGTVTAGTVAGGVVTAGVVTATGWAGGDSVVGGGSAGAVRGCGSPRLGAAGSEGADPEGAGLEGAEPEGAGFEAGRAGSPDRAGGVDAAAVTTTPPRPGRATARGARTRAACGWPARRGAASSRIPRRADRGAATSRAVVWPRELENAAAATAVESDAWLRHPGMRGAEPITAAPA
jgi:hypothetical protein